MNDFNERLIIELFNCNSKKNKKDCNVNLFSKNEVKEKIECSNGNKYSDSNNLESIITSHIKKRGFEDFVEIKKVETRSDEKLSSFVIISNRVIKDLQIDELIKVINRELDKILYRALKNASKDFSTQQMVF